MNDKLSIYTDGGARGNPGPAASAFVVKDSSGKNIYSSGYYLGQGTNNQAEYEAVVKAFEWLMENLHSQYSSVREISFYLDSLLVVNQINGLYKVKDPLLIIKYQNIMNTKKQILISQQVAIKPFEYIPRALNSAADALVNRVLDSRNGI